MQFVDGVRPRTPLSPVLNLAPMSPAVPKSIPTAPTYNRVTSFDGMVRRKPLMTPAATPQAQETTMRPSEFITGERRNIVLPWRQIGLASLAVSIAASTAFGLYQYRLSQATLPAAETTLRTTQQIATTETAASQAAAVQEAQQKAQAVTEQSAQIQTMINQLAIGAPAGIVVKDLKTGAVGGANQTQVFTSASLYKLFVAHGIYKDIDSGKRRLSDRINGRSLSECLNLMITVSDNGCAEALGSSLGWSKYNSTLKSYGFAQTKFGPPMQTSANDVAILLERLYGGTLLSPSSTNHFMGLMKAQKVNNRLPKGLPAGTVIAHKTGDLNGLMHDAGIVFGPKTDYIVVMASGPWATPTNSFAAFASLARQTWATLEQ